MTRPLRNTLGLTLRSASQQTLNPFESRAAGAASIASPAVPGLGRSSGLSEIALSDGVVAKLRRCLNPLGFDIGQEVIDDPVTGVLCNYTLVRRATNSRPLIRLPDAVLTNPARENLRLVNEIREGITYEFSKEKNEIRLYVFYGENPHGTYKLLMEQRWPQQGVRPKFIPLSEVDDLDTMNEELRIQSVQRMLDLDVAASPGPVNTRPTKIDVEQLFQLIKLVADLSDFRDADAARRRAFVETAGTANVLTNFNFQGPSRSVAELLLLRLIEHSALGSFLKVIRLLPDLKTEDREFLESLIKHYALTDG